MPTAIAFFIQGALGLYLAPAVVGTIITGIVTIGLAVGVSALSKAVFGSSGGKPSDGQQTIRQPVGSRKRYYGIVHTGGLESFRRSQNGTLARVITLGTGEDSEILEHRINDKPVTVVDGTVTEPSFHGAVKIYTRPGSDDQSAIAELTAQFPEWTENHRQRGCPHVAILCGPVKPAQFSEVYNGQVPAYTQIRKAAKVYSPLRDSTAVIYDDGEGFTVNGTGPQRLGDRATWEWDDNGALVIADYFAHPDGYGAGYDSVNWVNIAQEANFADEDVETVGGDTIKRWRLWGGYDLVTDERRQVLTDMQKAVDAFSWQDAEGRFNLMLGRYEAPEIVITDDHILGMQMTLGPPAGKRVEAIKMLYTEASIGYREQESATIFDPALGSDPTASPQGMPAFFIPHHNQAMRVGKIVFNQLGDRWRGTVLLNLFGLNLIGERFARIETAQLGVAASFKVERLRLLLNQDPPKVEATVTEVRPEDWDFDAATEEGTPPVGASASGASATVPAPTGLALSAVQLAFGETGGVAIAASWSGPTRADLTFEAQYSADGADDWVPMGVDDEARTARSGPVDSGGIYDVRVRSVTLLGRPSDWTESTITPTTNPTPLAAPTILSTSVGAGSTTIAFRMPRAAPLAYARRYRSTSNDFTTAVQIGGDIIGALGERIERTDTGLVPGTTYYHWVRAFDDAGVPSALAGPAAATIFYGPGTNLFSAPENFADSVWVKASDGSGSAAPVVTANAATAPDGTMTADTIAFTRGASGYSVIYQGAVATIGNSYKIGVWLKAPSAGLSVALRLGDTNGPALSLTTSWAYYELSATAPYATTNAGLIIWNIIGSSPTSTTIDAWAGQFRA